MKQVILLASLVIITGCAPKYSKQQIAQASANLASSQRAVHNIQSKLSENKAYTSQGCRLPARYKKPAIYVTTEKQAKEYSTAYCYSPIACEVSALTFDVDTATERFLNSQACGIATDALRADGQVTNSTINNIFESFVDSRCQADSNGFWEGLWRATNCVMSASAKLTKISTLNHCLDNKHKQLLKTSQDWYNYPQK